MVNEGLKREQGRVSSPDTATHQHAARKKKQAYGLQDFSQTDEVRGQITL